jgi:hypothetical protein
MAGILHQENPHIFNLTHESLYLRVVVPLTDLKTAEAVRFPRCEDGRRFVR